MGGKPSCSVKCCCCSPCCNYRCCSCCPCYKCCGCWCREERCYCQCDPIRKYADNNVYPAPTAESAIPNGGNDVANRSSSKQDDVGDAVTSQPVSDGTGIFPMVVRPSSQISQSTGMELQLSDTSRSASMFSDRSLSDVTSTDVEARDGVCIDGKFYPRNNSIAADEKGKGGKPERECNFSVSNIISVSITDKVTPSGKMTDRDEVKQDSPELNGSQAPRRLAKIDIKEERRKMMSELSQFKRRKSKRRKKKNGKVSREEVNSAFEEGDVNTRETNKGREGEEGSQTRSLQSLQFSSSASDTDFYDIDRIRTVRVRGSLTGSSSGTDSNILNIIKESQEDAGSYVPEYQYSHHQTLNFNNKSHSGVAAPPSSHPTAQSSSSPLDSEVETNSSGSFTITTGQTTTNISQTVSWQSVTSDNRGGGTGNSTSSQYSSSKPPDTKNENSTIDAVGKHTSSRQHANSDGVLFPSASGLGRHALVQPGERTVRGLSMSRHFQGQAAAQAQSQQQLSGSSNLSTLGNSSHKTSSSQGRPMSAMFRHMTGGSGHSSRYDDGFAPGDVKEHAGSLGNSDQGSVTSLTSSTGGRPLSTYGIRTHSEAVHSLQRWRNMKVNPF